MYRETWNRYIQDRYPVTIRRKHIDTPPEGYWVESENVWAVIVDEDCGQEFWLESFEALEDAETFCQDRNLPYEVERR